MALRMSQMLRCATQVRRRPVPPRARVRKQPADQVELDPLFAPGAPAPFQDVSGNQTKGTAGIYGMLVQAAQLLFETPGEPPDAAPLIGAVRQVFGALREGDGLLAETVRQRRALHSWAHRAANTAILSMRIGMELGCDERRTLGLGLCALMHDLGMSTLPEEILKRTRLTPEQLERVRRHPLESQKIVQGFGKAFAWIGKVVVQVHERQDGSGYPAALKGDQIHEFARIIGLADIYEAMAHPRADREARVVYSALKEIIDLRNTLFDRRLIKALINIVSIFPLGSLVKLNSGEVGRVIGTNRLHPMRPRMELLLDARGRRLEKPRVIELGDEPMLYIVDPAIKEGVLKE